MAYTVLARRYRSQRFDDVIGQDSVAVTLKNAIQSGRVAHAYLFCGTRGVGKTTMARILAKSLNCLNSDQPTTKPCLKCDSCISINLGEDIDVVEIDGASNTGVENIRQLRENALYRPARARFKIYIIDEVHMLSTGAFNALLKILEEPPEHVKFIFATTEPNKILPTIQSRCQRFDFANIPPTTIAKQLQKVLDEEKVKYDNDLLVRISRLANGSMRDGLSLLDKLLSTGEKKLNVELLEDFLGQPGLEQIIKLVTDIAEHDASSVLVSLNDLLNSGKTAYQVVDSLCEYMRDLMVLSAAGENDDLIVLTAEQKSAAGKLVNLFDLPAIIYAITTLEKLRWAVKTADNPRPLLEAALLRLTLSEHFMAISEILKSAQTQKISAKQSQTPAKASVKKNAPLNNKENSSPAHTTDESKDSIDIKIPADFESIKKNWPEILNVLKKNSPAGTFMANSQPSDFANGRLTIAFSKEQMLQMQMCQKRSERISSIISRIIDTDISINTVEASGPQDQKKITRKKPPGARISTVQREKALADPGVQMLLNCFNAQTTDISLEKDSSND